MNNYENLRSWVDFHTPTPDKADCRNEARQLLQERDALVEQNSAIQRFRIEDAASALDEQNRLHERIKQLEAKLTDYDALVEKVKQFEAQFATSELAASSYYIQKNKLEYQLSRIREALPSEGIAHASLGEAYRQCLNAVITIRKELEGVQEKAPE